MGLGIKRCPNCHALYGEDARMCVNETCQSTHEWHPGSLETIELSFGTPPFDPSKPVTIAIEVLCMDCKESGATRGPRDEYRCARCWEIYQG